MPTFFSIANGKQART